MGSLQLSTNGSKVVTLKKCTFKGSTQKPHINGITYTINTGKSTKLMIPKLSEKPVRHTPWTAEWMVNALKTDNLSMAVGKLATWFPNNRGKEASEETVLALRKRRAILMIFRPSIQPRRLSDAFHCFEPRIRFCHRMTSRLRATTYHRSFRVLTQSATLTPIPFMVIRMMRQRVLLGGVYLEAAHLSLGTASSKMNHRSRVKSPQANDVFLNHRR